MELEHYTQQEADKRCEIGKLNVPVRFFTYAYVDDELDIIEVTESEFLETEGAIEYERHSVKENGVSQICLTKGNI